MLEDDVQLIRRILSGDDSAFSTLVEKTSQGCPRAYMAKDWRFSPCRGTHPRCFSSKYIENLGV